MMKKRKYGLGKKLFLSLMTVVILLLIGEAFTRKYYQVKPESRWSQHHFRVGSLGFSDLNEIMEPDPDLFWRVKANLENRYIAGFVGTETFLDFQISTDAHGFRKAGGAGGSRNIIFLGDSCTFGIGVKAEETYVHLAGSALKMGTRNLSCPGYTLFQGRKLLARVGWEPKPAALVAAFGFNDRLMWDGLTDEEQAKVLSRGPSRFARISRLFYCVELAVEGCLSLYQREIREKSRRVPPEQFEAEAADLVREAKEKDIPVVFLFWPRIEWMDEPGLGHPYAEVIQELGDGYKVTILDMAEAFRKGGGRSLFLDGIHAKPEGHQIAADLLLEALEIVGVIRDS